MNKKIMIFRIGITLVVAFILFYLTLPAINLTNPGFYGYLFCIFLVYFFSSWIKLFDTRNIIKNVKTLPRNVLVMIGSVFGVFVLIMVVNFILSPVFNAKSWSRRIVIDQTHEFNDDIALVNYQSLPLLDKDSSRKLGDRVMGQMPELVSQFYVSDLYTQINYNADIVRVTPLEYNGFIKYLNNRKNGVKGYITVNSVTGDADLVKLDKGMQYMPSAYFFDNLHRHLRFKYPTVIFDDEKFEIDNDGNPYWVVPTVRYSGVGIKKEITGVILVNAIDGSSQKYDVGSIPTWVDQVYSAELIIEQVDNWGLYKNGFINSLFTQNGVVQTTEGYNYTVMNDDVYLYTGITSVLADESNIGFIMTNLRTKETRFYQVPGAEEYSAMASAEGQVQQMKYEASFPLLINLNGRPTYLMSLKDAAGLVKMYAFVDVGDYQKVVVSDSSLGIETASSNYLSNVNLNLDTNTLLSKKISIREISNVIIDGNTYYYLIGDNGQKYRASIKVNSDILPFLKVGSSIEVKYVLEEDVIEIKDIK